MVADDAAMKVKQKSDLPLTPPEPREAARCVAIAAKGIRTGGDFASMMSAMMADIAEDRIKPQVANALCNAGGKLLKVVEMQYRYGSENADKKHTLQLAD